MYGPMTEGEGKQGLAGRIETLKTFISKNQLSVLVVEDDPMSRTFLEKMMKRLSIHADFAGDGLEAMRFYSRNIYDLVLMDIQMPVMNGYETVRLIREQEKLVEIRVPIVAVTAYALEEDRQKCLEAGMDDYLAKPISVDDLLQVIQRWCCDDEST